LENYQKEIHNEDIEIEVISDTIWHISFAGAPSTLYDGERFTLRVRFTDDYPMDSPEVVFVENPPVHPHVYSNGHICLNILADDWTPALTVKSVVLSIQSMLSSATEKKLPEDNSRYTSRNRSNAKETHFVFHDDKV
jgi:ubiquitin-conjugating enzyme E2 W